jgi:hypothetical protein
LYPTRFVPATLPLDHPGLARSVRSRPEPVGAGLAGGVVAVRLADLAAVDGVDGTPVLVATGPARPRDGDLVAWCTVTAVAPAVLDADGRLGAEGWLPDHVRLGVLEEHLGRGTVERVVAASEARAPVQDEEAPRRRQRLMSLPLVARFVLAMTLLPHASYVEVFTQLVGTLPRLPWARAWHVTPVEGRRAGKLAHPAQRTEQHGRDQQPPTRQRPTATPASAQRHPPIRTVVIPCHRDTHTHPYRGSRSHRQTFGHRTPQTVGSIGQVAGPALRTRSRSQITYPAPHCGLRARYDHARRTRPGGNCEIRRRRRSLNGTRLVRRSPSLARAATSDAPKATAASTPNPTHPSRKK